ncbi:MAG: GatB/YqeY domain-containing protein [Chloroflexota bacterium]
MNLQQQINDDLKQAMLNKDDIAKLTLRDVKTGILELLKSGQVTSDSLEDAQVLSVIQRLAKRRREAASEFEKAGQDDRAAEELSELKVLEKYLPQQMSEDEITLIIKEIIAETGASSAREMGKVMSAAMAKVSGKADGKLVNQIARTLLAD